MLDTRSKPQPTGVWYRISYATHGGVAHDEWQYSALSDYWQNVDLPYGQLVEVWSAQ